MMWLLVGSEGGRPVFPTHVRRPCQGACTAQSSWLEVMHEKQLWNLARNVFFSGETRLHRDTPSSFRALRNHSGRLSVAGRGHSWRATHSETHVLPLTGTSSLILFFWKSVVDLFLGNFSKCGGRGGGKEGWGSGGERASLHLLLLRAGDLGCHACLACL